METKITIRDIANHAKVGTTTVSRVLNNHPYVSEDKRQRVLDAIDTLNYRPSQMARNLRGGASGLIGILTDEVVTTPYAVDIIGGAQEAAWAHDMVLLIADIGKKPEAIDDMIEMLLDRQVEGIVYATMYHRAVELPSSLNNVPTVLANCFVEDESLPAVVPDEYDGGYNATLELLRAGHQRIGFINLGQIGNGVPLPLPAITGRLKGYQAALAEYGIAFDKELVRYTNQSPEGNYHHAKALMSLPNPPTAIFCGNDKIAMSCYGVFAELGLKIPDDVALVGFDNIIDIAEGLLPTLTTLQLPHFEMGKQAIEYLLNLDNQDKVPQLNLLPCPLVRRESV